LCIHYGTADDVHLTEILRGLCLIFSVVIYINDGICYVQHYFWVHTMYLTYGWQLKTRIRQCFTKSPKSWKKSRTTISQKIPICVLQNKCPDNLVWEYAVENGKLWKCSDKYIIMAAFLVNRSLIYVPQLITDMLCLS